MTDPEKDIRTASTNIQPLIPGEADSTRTNDGATRANDAAAPPADGNAVQRKFNYLGPPQAPDEIGRLGGYRVLRLLGQGGMGVVFEGDDPMLGRRVAIKVPSTHITGEAHRKRFIREARIAATLSNDHIAAIYQAGEQVDLLFLVMELLRGEPLNKRLDREKTLPLDECLRIAREVADGLREAHGHGLVHRDIKPANIWLEERQPHQGPPRVKILDFGLARETKPEVGITAVGNIVGTIGYMAPEQVYAGEVDGRTDLFALGVVLYEMLTGRLPFKGGNTVDSLRSVVYEQPEPIAEVAPHLPASLVHLVNDLLQKDPANRPASAEIVVQRLMEIEAQINRAVTKVAGGVPAACPPGRRHVWGIAVGVGALIVAIVAGIVVLAQRYGQPQPPDQAPSAGGAAVSAEAGAPIKVGILHSLTGSLAPTEAPLVDAAVLAMKQINAAGGVGGRLIDWTIQDGRSIEQGFADGAEALIRDKHVVAIFGCWTSSSRKRVEEICRKYDNLLVYPINYEGLEDSPFVIYTGGAPNQQIDPAVGFAIGTGRHKFFLVGSDQVYSHACSAIIRDLLTAKFKHAQCLGEEYVPSGQAMAPRCAEIAKLIKKSGADAVFSTVDGYQANVAFFHALAGADVTAKEFPVFSFSFFEEELRHLEARDTAGHYAVASYFESIDTPANQEFLKQFHSAYPTGAVNDPMETAYCGVYLWKQAVVEAGADRPAAVREAMAHQAFDGPEGRVAIDPANRHAIRRARIAQVLNNQQFKIEWTSNPITPEPFPPTRSPKQWDQFLLELRRGWGGRWEGK